MKRSPANLAVLTVSFLVLAGCLSTASAQTGSPPKDDEIYVREELQRVIGQEPEKAAEAQKVLDILNLPESSREGRRARNRRERGVRRIVNGIPSHSYPAVGALLEGSDPRTARAWCTGTLVGCDKFLTAAHCIADNPSPGSYLVFFQELGFVRVKAIRWEKDKHKFPYFDLAMLTLEKPVDGVAPMPINKSVKPLNGSTATIAGFGRTGGRHFDYGIKREGTIKTAACPVHYASSQVLCWRFDADFIFGTSAQNTCHADSGGGVFMRDNEGRGVVEKLFGVVSGGTDNNCMKDDLAYNSDVFQYRDWIETAGEGRLSSAMCGAPLWKDEAQQPEHTILRLDAGKPEATLSFEVLPGAGALRISMNGEDDGSWKSEFAFVVNRGAATGEDMCKGTGSGRQFAFCAVEKPEPGTWIIRVMRKKGEGEVQITRLTAGAGQ